MSTPNEQLAKANHITRPPFNEVYVEGRRALDKMHEQYYKLCDEVRDRQRVINEAYGLLCGMEFDAAMQLLKTHCLTIPKRGDGSAA